MMEMTDTDRRRIAEAIRDKYRQVARDVRGRFKYPTGPEGLAALGYDPALYGHLPAEVLAGFCGVGNPFSAGPVRPGWAVLDVGCGQGVDACIAARQAEPGGRVTGLDGSPEMLGRAKANALLAGAGNLAFVEGEAGALPFANAGFDLVLSSGVYNLVIDKPRALAEAFRVLKPGGRLQVADQMLTGPPPLSVAEQVANWFG